MGLLFVILCLFSFSSLTRHNNEVVVLTGWSYGGVPLVSINHRTVSKINICWSCLENNRRKVKYKQATTIKLARRTYFKIICSQAFYSSPLFALFASLPHYRGPVTGGGPAGMHVPRLNFKPCHVAISEGLHVTVGMCPTSCNRYPSAVKVFHGISGVLFFFYIFKEQERMI